MIRTPGELQNEFHYLLQQYLENKWFLTRGQKFDKDERIDELEAIGKVEAYREIGQLFDLNSFEKIGELKEKVEQLRTQKTNVHIKPITDPKLRELEAEHSAWRKDHGLE